MKTWLAVLVAASIAPFAQGCVVSDCSNGQTNCVQVEPAVRYESSPRTVNAPYTAGQAIHIVSPNGDVKVVVGGTGQVAVTFQPFILDKKNNDAAAKNAMDTQLTTSASASTGEVLVQATRASGASGGLGADVTVTVPSNFNGAFRVDQGNGDTNVSLGGSSPSATNITNPGAGGISVTGAAGPLTIDASVGDVSVDVAAWAAAGQNGSIHAGNGKITFAVPTGANGQMTLVAKDGMIATNNIPSTWASSENQGGKSYTMNGGTGALVTVTNDFGDIELDAK